MAPMSDAEAAAPEDSIRTPRGFDRFVYFSDAVVAIAISLLILPVVDAVSEAKAAEELTGVDFFRDNGDRLLAFGISFVVIASFWVVHHRLFESVRDYTSGLLWLNLAWLATIVFLPLPTEIIAVQGAADSYAVRVVYILSVFAVSVLTEALGLLVDRTPAIRRRPQDRAQPLRVRFVAPGMILVALALATVPAIGMWALLVMALTGPISKRLGATDG
jgi:uncharacterized membrane protein